jgi:hypothetical protein
MRFFRGQGLLIKGHFYRVKGVTKERLQLALLARLESNGVWQLETGRAYVGSFPRYLVEDALRPPAEPAVS